MARRRQTPEELRRLTEHFRAMGAFDPESWAKSQLVEGIPAIRAVGISSASVEERRYGRRHVMDRRAHSRTPVYHIGVRAIDQRRSMHFKTPGSATSPARCGRGALSICGAATAIVPT